MGDLGPRAACCRRDGGESRSADECVPAAAAGALARSNTNSGSGGNASRSLFFGIDEDILANSKLHDAIAYSLPANYNFEIEKSIQRIRQVGARHVVLQFPEGLLAYSLAIAAILEHFTDADAVTVMGDVAYGACCVDDLTAKALGADLLIHYGHSCLVPIEQTAAPQTRRRLCCAAAAAATPRPLHCLYVFVDIIFDFASLIDAVAANLPRSQAGAGGAGAGVATGAAGPNVPPPTAPPSLANAGAAAPAASPAKPPSPVLSGANGAFDGKDAFSTAPGGCAVSDATGPGADAAPGAVRPPVGGAAADSAGSGAATASAATSAAFALPAAVAANSSGARTPAPASASASAAALPQKGAEPRFALLGTIQYSKVVHSAARALGEKYGAANVLVPRVAPLTPGEVLGCTSPTLPLSLDFALFIADGRFHLESAMIANPAIPFFRYDPFVKRLFRERYDFAKMRENRAQALGRLRAARHVGLILGTLGRQGSVGIFERLKNKLEGAGVRYTLLLMSEIMPHRLEMLAPNGAADARAAGAAAAALPPIDAFVQVSCPRLSIDWGHCMPAPLLSPFEAVAALAPPAAGRSAFSLTTADDVYPMDYYSMENGGPWTNFFVDGARSGAAGGAAGRLGSLQPAPSICVTDVQARRARLRERAALRQRAAAGGP